MFKTLYAKLVISLLVLLSLVGTCYLAIALYMTPLYLQELNQKLHRTLAGNLVKEQQLLENQQINHTALKTIFHNLMVINPSIEVYLSDNTGKLLAYSAPPGKVKRQSISLEPIHRFLAQAKEFPILGDDPRGIQRQKVFSAAPIKANDQLQGYLYIVLGSEEYDSITQLINGSYILQLTVGSAIIAILIAVIAGIILFNLLTRRLRLLTEVMSLFKQSDFQHPVTLPARYDGRAGDEIDVLGTTFQHMSERIIQQVKQLQHTDASRRELVANVSHDLRTPLASLQGYLETLSLKDSILSQGDKQHYIELALKHSQRLGKLISELFELAMLDTQGTQSHFETISLSELLQDVAQKFRLKAEDRKLTLKTFLPKDAMFVSADIAMLERVLENLLENAIKYTQIGGTVSLTLTQENNKLITRVEDTGQGIPAEDLPHIFERFYRVEKHRKSSPEGTGLGLAISKRILQLHDSPINVTSTLGEGTCFSFVLPNMS